MRFVYLLLCLSGVVRVHTGISVKKLVYVEASVDAKDAISKDDLANVITELKKVVCMPGEECEVQKSGRGTTYRPYYYYTTRRPCYPGTYGPCLPTTYRPYYYNSGGYWNGTQYVNTTRSNWNPTTYRPYYYNSGGYWNGTEYVNTTRSNWNPTTYRPYYYNSGGYWNGTQYVNSTRSNWNPTTYRPYYYTTRRYWNATSYRPYHYTDPPAYRPHNYTKESSSPARIYRRAINTTSDSSDETWTLSYFEGDDEKGMFDCSDLPSFSPSGVYNISTERGAVEVFCDMETDGGNWTVIQSRDLSSPLNMNKTWEEYRDGFGKLKEAFWLGNKQISDMTTRREYSMRIDMRDIYRNNAFAEYELFQVQPENEMFRLFIRNYTGDAGDALSYNVDSPFSTFDQNNDMDGPWPCAREFSGGWWYRKCYILAGLNSYQPVWIDKRLVTTEMKIRPVIL